MPSSGPELKSTRSIKCATAPPTLRWRVGQGVPAALRQIKEYIATQPEAKRSDLQELHRITLEMMPGCKLWFLDGKDEKGKTVSNPNMGYGVQTRKYADGKPESTIKLVSVQTPQESLSISSE